MRLATRLAAVAGAACLVLIAAWPASAKPVEHFTYHDEFDTTNDCGDGLVLEFHDVRDGRVLVVERGDNRLYLTEQVSLTAVTTIPGTDLTLTVVNKGLVWNDVHATDNGDGTYTMRSISPARVSVLGPNGRTVSHFSGVAIYEARISDGGTPEDGTDDEFLESVSETLHGHGDSAGICEVAQQYLPVS